MKKIFTIALLILIALSSCAKINTPGGIVVWGSKETKNKSFNFQHFNEIVIGDKFEVTIHEGENYSIDVKCNENLVDFTDRKKWTVLSVKMKPNHFYKDAILEVDITMPELTYLDINGMSNVNIDNFRVKNLEIEVSESSILSGNITADKIKMLIKSGSKTDLSGNATVLQLDGTIGANIDMSKLNVSRALIYLSVGSTGVFQLDDLFSAEVRNKSSLKYSGNATERKIIKDDSSELIKQ